MVETAISKLSDNQIVLVDGATGYLGNHVVAALSQQGAKVHALVRPQATPADIAFLEQCGAQIFQADLTNFQNTPAGQKRKLEDAFAGITAAVHLIGSVAPGKNEKFAQLHQEQSRAFASWCVRAKDVGGFAHAAMITSLGADLDSPSEYLRSKREAELALLAELDGAQITSTIFRPSLIVGRTVGRRDSKLVKRYRHLARTRPLVPLINGGKNLVQPVFVADLAEAIVTKISAAGVSDICEIGGLAPISMRQVVSEILSVLGIKKSFFDIPVPVALAAAGVMQRFQNVPLVSKDQALMAGFDNICHDNKLAEIIGRPPTELGQALSTYRNWDGD